MKASPNREQLLFLAAGGVILVVIVVVVLFNVMRVPRQVIEEKIVPRPMVAMPEKEAAANSTAPADSPWISKRVAPVFENGRVNENGIEVEGFRKEEKSDAPPPEEEEDPVAVKSSRVVPPASAKTAESPPAKPVEKPAAKSEAEKLPEKAGLKPAVAEKPAPPKVETPPAGKEATKAPPAAAPGKGAFAVSLGSFSDEKNAGSLQGRIASLGVPVYTQKVTVGGKTFYRVRSGPYATREDANNASRIVSQKAGLRGTVVAHGD